MLTTDLRVRGVIAVPPGSTVQRVLTGLSGTGRALPRSRAVVTGRPAVAIGNRMPSTRPSHAYHPDRNAFRRRSRCNSTCLVHVERGNVVRQASRERLVARIPADVEMPDRIFANLSARQVAILTVTGVLAAWVYLMAGDLLPVPVLAAIVVPLIACGCALALGRRDGLGLDRLAVHALAYLRRDRKLVTAEEEVPEPPAWCRVRGRLPGMLRLPVKAIREDGIMELAEGGTAAVVQAGTVAFGLRTGDEQAALVGVFAGWLNSLDAPVQILLQARPVDLSNLAGMISGTAGDLADPALEQAAHQHAEFLTELSASRDLLTRDVLIVVRHDDAEQPPLWKRGPRLTARRDTSAAIVTRRAEETVRSLLALGVHASVLDADNVRGLLVRSLSPRRVEPVGIARPDESITLGEDVR